MLKHLSLKAPAGQPAARRRSSRAKPEDAVRSARRRFVRGERIDLQEIATELGINRVTLYRWFGTREGIAGEVLCEFADEAWDFAGRETRARGPEYVARRLYHFLRSIQTFEPFQRFVAASPEHALRVLTSRHSRVQAHVVGLVRQLLDREQEAGRLSLPNDLDSLAYALIRISESFLYNDLITGRESDLDKALPILAALLQAPWKQLRL
jgi:AcrR family transcriptional regulator